jgi:hypothetical protein
MAAFWLKKYKSAPALQIGVMKPENSIKGWKRLERSN